MPETLRVVEHRNHHRHHPEHAAPVNKLVMQIELELQELRRRAGIDLTEAPITEEDLKIVERCARALGVKLADDQWLQVWRLLRQGVHPIRCLPSWGSWVPGVGRESSRGSSNPRKRHLPIRPQWGFTIVEAVELPSQL